jgi:hypothetical protein
MDWRRAREGLLGIVAAGVIGTSGLAVADDEALKDSMEKSLENLQPLLIGLINSDYEAVLHDVEPILEHGSQLTRTVPDSAKEHRDEFLAYAYYLRKNAEILKSTVEMIIRNEQPQKGKTGPFTFLPVVAATHYGGIVNMCVACHSRFRVPLEE